MKYDCNETVLEETLQQVLSGETPMEDTVLEYCIVRSYRETGMMTYNKGLVLRLADGSEFQLTIVQSR